MNHTLIEENQLVISVEKSRSKLFKNWKEELAMAPKKVDFLEKFQPANGLTITKYPAGTLLSNIEKAAQCVAQIMNFDDAVFQQVKASHQSIFLLVRTSTPAHVKCEQYQRKTGGYDSVEIYDLGDFRVVLCDGDRILRTADFTLYRAKDTFVI